MVTNTRITSNNTSYVTIFERQNLQKQFVDQYYKKLFLKIGGNHFKMYFTLWQLRIYIFKNALSF